MYEKRSFIEQSYPKVTSDYWDKKAEELWSQFLYYDEASQDLRQNIWPECMKAYLCRFDLPENEGLDWPSMSDLHETDIWDATNFHSDAILNALLSRDGQYMEMLSTQSEDQATLNDIRDLMYSIHRRSDLRGQYGKHIKQLLIYGTSAIWWQWLEKEVYKSFGPMETARRLAEQNPPIILPEDQLLKQYNKYKFLETDYVGPVIRTIDMYDFWMDPTGDLAIDRDVSMITRFYLSEDDMKNALDDQGMKKYENLEGIEPKTLEQIFQKDSDERYDLMRELGLSPTINEGPQGGRLVPIYLFHQPVRHFEDGDQFIDTFFYVAEATGKNGKGAKIIRVESNPHRNGSRGIYIDNYIDAPGSATYGIGAVEKSLKAWQSKCVISELGLAAAMASVFPAYNVVGGVLQDDRELKVAPGSFNVIKNPGNMGPGGFMAPIPAPLNSVPLGQSVEQWFGQKILGQFGSLAQVAIQDPTKNVKESKTATQINVESTTGSVMRDAIIEKLSIRSLEPLLQDIYDAARQHLKDPTFERTVDTGSSELGTVSTDVLNQDRRVLATGFRAMINKNQEIQEMQQVLATLSQGDVLALNPNLRMVYQEAIFKILGLLGIRNLEKYKQDPMQMLLQDPKIQQQLMAVAQQISGMPPQQPNSIEDQNGQQPPTAA